MYPWLPIKFVTSQLDGRRSVHPYREIQLMTMRYGCYTTLDANTLQIAVCGVKFSAYCLLVLLFVLLHIPKFARQVAVVVLH